MSITLEAKDGVLHYLTDGKRFTLTGGEFTEVVVPGATNATKISGIAAERLMNDTLNVIRENGVSAKEVKALLPTAIKEFTGANHVLSSEVKNAIDAVAQIETATDAAAAKKLLMDNKLSLNLLTEKASTTLGNLKINASDVQAEIKKAADKILGLKAANEELALLMKAEKIDHAVLDGAIRKHLTHLDKLDPGAEAIANAQARGFNFGAAVTAHKDEISRLTAKYEQLAKDAIPHHDVLRLKLGSTSEAAARAETAAQEALTKINDELKLLDASPYKDAAREKIAESVVKDLKSASPEMAARFESGAARVAGKTAWGWSKSAEEIAANAAKTGGKSTIMQKLWGNRGVTGKGAVVAGIGAIGYTVVSAIGGRGPGEKAAEVSRSREGVSEGRTA